MFFKSVKVIKGKENVGNCPKLEETKKSGPLNAIHDLRLYSRSERKKDNSGTIGKILRSIDRL